MLKKLCFLIFIFSVMFFTLNTFDYLNIPGDSDDEQNDMYGGKVESIYNYTYISHTSFISLTSYKVLTNRDIIDDPQFDFI
ncbi:MAG: hypothetical protein ABRQ37_13335 [Candidatus Eremiobacterota bacterium]